MTTIDHYETILVEQRGHVRWITLNRPDRRNAISPAMISDLGDALAAARCSGEVRVLVIAAAGKAFCAGADLGDDPTARPDLSVLEASTALFNELEDFPCPVIGVVQGVACAGGLELLLCCDLIIAAESVKMADIHANVGLIPGAGGAYRLTHRVGISMAKRMLYSGDFFSAEELRQAGLVTKVVPDAELTAEAEQLSSALAEKSPLSLAAMKRLANAALTADRAHAMSAALEENRLHFTTRDYHEGLDALAERRKPVYTGE